MWSIYIFTSLTIPGGFFIALITVISEHFNVFREIVALIKAGSASAKSLSQSSLMACEAAAASFANASSAATIYNHRWRHRISDDLKWYIFKQGKEFFLFFYLYTYLQYMI